MKKFNTFLLALTSAFLIAGCSPSNTTSEETPVINQQANSVAIVLNLTSVGLYNGAKGTANPALFLENTVTVNLKVGDKLPTKEQITSTSKDTEFHSWIYYDKGGILSSTVSVVDGILTYQAHFEFVGEFEGEPSGGGSENTGGKIYFMDATWWNKDGATSSFYAWGGTASYVWPGVVMKLEETLSNSRKIWSIEIDVSSFTGFMFARTGSGAATGSTGAADWGAKTADLTPSQLGANNLVILNTSAAWGVGVACTFATYVPGKTNY